MKGQALLQVKTEVETEAQRPDATVVPLNGSGPT